MHKICIRREALESSTPSGTSPVREVVPRAIPPPPPKVDPTHLEVYGDVARGSLAGHPSRAPAIGSGDYSESFERDEWDITKPAFLESGVVMKKGITFS